MNMKQLFNFFKRTKSKRINQFNEAYWIEIENRI